ncbi:hypothetical protein [Acidiphilium sp.]|uniref:hypothetical protein n=1 Tax=Acidiphilium sp. TaxID=527 RepID=UPI000BCFF58D|nr:hypothetical protein [Acidiphilium sp.]OZB40280.1 MAG: hypothetical protein B7X48_05625 [Acidiphilium sp. 34-60-192]
MTNPAKLQENLRAAADQIADVLSTIDAKLDILLAAAAAEAAADRAWASPPKAKANGHAKGNGQ